MKTGTIKFFNASKGYGFIKQDEDPGKDLFVHQSGLIDRVKQDDRVSFEIGDSPKGPTAINVKKIDE